MPSFDNTLAARFMRAGMPAANATEIASVIANNQSTYSTSSAMTISATTLTFSGTTARLAVNYVDGGAATAGAVTVNSPRGRFSVPAGVSAVTLTCSNILTATSAVFCSLRATDGTLTRISTVSVSSGSAVITFDAAATTGGLAIVDFFVVN